MTRQRSTPLDPTLNALKSADPHRPLALLHSGRPHPRWATHSTLAHPAAHYRLSAHRQPTLTDPLGQPLPLAAQLTGNPWDDLRTLLAHPDLPGQWIGYLSYDLARLIEPRKLAPPAPTDWPLIDLAYCPDPTDLPTTPEPETPAPTDPLPIDDLQADFTPAQYQHAIRRALDYIAAGDVFQVNLAQRFTTTHTGSLRELYARLAAVSPAWYGAYLELPPLAPGEPARALLSTSPELFLQVQGRHVLTRPIKGTRPPHQHDDLLHSPKDTAELNMIVDLMRNDLGRVCDYGSVRVTQPRTIETHPTIHHGVATVEGTLHRSRDIVDLLRATLPGGSVTGAPKVRAMQIIDELEPVHRGPYCGCIGSLSHTHANLNIAIRTLTATQPHPDAPHQLSFHVGGGIVADSDPAEEYTETLTKAQAILRALSR